MTALRRPLRAVSERTNETAMKATALRFIQGMGVWAFKVHCGRRGRIQLAPEGTPDIWTQYGWLEGKTETGKLSPAQVAWHERARREGVNVATFRSPREALEQVLRWKGGAT